MHDLVFESNWAAQELHPDLFKPQVHVFKEQQDDFEEGEPVEQIKLQKSKSE